MNKKDLVTPEELEDVVGNIKGVNSFAKILITERSKVDLQEVLGISSFSIERSLEMDPTLADQMSDDEEEEVRSQRKNCECKSMLCTHCVLFCWGSGLHG